ncbi:MAG: VTT domain-containing protein, partial [Anaerolineales bacterium]
SQIMLSSNLRLNIARALSLIAVVAITLYVYSIRDQARELAVYGYPGIFLIALLTNATVLLPAPGIAVVFAMGNVFNPFGVALAAGMGGALGELSGYLAGFSGQAVIERVDLYDRMTRWMRRNGPLTIFILAAIPNPFFDIAGIAAGALNMSLPRFLFWAWLGVTLKMFLFAWAGASSLSWIFGE